MGRAATPQYRANASIPNVHGAITKDLRPESISPLSTRCPSASGLLSIESAVPFIRFSEGKVKQKKGVAMDSGVTAYFGSLGLLGLVDSYEWTCQSTQQTFRRRRSGFGHWRARRP